MISWILIGIGVILGVIILMALYYYNRFVTLENRIDNSSSQIDVQLRKRAELVPNLVQVVKGYAKHEKGIMDDITKSRKALLSAGNIQDKVKAGDVMQNALRSIFALAENYPTLTANKNFLHLQEELSAIEDKIAYARQYYNDSVMDYENASEQFPGVFFFKLYGRQKKNYLQIPELHRKVPKIDL